MPDRRSMRIFLMLLVALAPMASPARAGLKPGDHVALTAALLNVSSLGSSAAREASTILEREAYDAGDLAGFFSVFFIRHALTDTLSKYLAHVALHSASDVSRRSLQEALSWVLMGEIETFFRSSPAETLGRRMQRNPTAFEHLRCSLQLLGTLAHRGRELSHHSRSAQYDRLAQLIAAHPRLLRKEVTLDTRAKPKLAAIRAHLYTNLRDLRIPFDPDDFIVRTGFWGAYAAIVRDHGILVLDNNGFDARQLEAIQELLALIPRGLHALTHITQHELLGNRRGTEVETKLVGSPGVNIFSPKVSARKANQFPPDVRGVVVPAFCSVLSHELNHGVDSFTIANDPTLSLRREQLLARAGHRDSMQYLRSMFPPDFFTTRPQEFFASIANEYFSSSLQTLNLARRRFRAGWHEPLNQFLFFAEVYSQGRDFTLFFEQDEECRFTSYAVPVGRDASGRIDRLHLFGVELRFKLDRAGNVLP